MQARLRGTCRRLPRARVSGSFVCDPIKQLRCELYTDGDATDNGLRIASLDTLPRGERGINRLARNERIRL